MAITSFFGKYRFLSNFYEASVTYRGLCFLSSEAAYQAAKCADFHERFAFQAMSAPESKRAGSRIYMRSDWDSQKLRIMFDIVRAKFDQNPELCARLCATGTEDLVEGNTWGDTYWGVCKGVGQNKLGKILMGIRDAYRGGYIPCFSTTEL